MPPSTQRTTRISRTSRKDAIPHDFILNWKSSETVRRTTPLVRRPTTACQPCRTAKAKCNGQRNCARCASRGISCTYENKKRSDESRRSEHLPPYEATPSMPTLTNSIPEDMSAEFGENDCINRFSMDKIAYNTPESMHIPEWDIYTNHQRLDDFDWGAIDPNLDIFNSQLTLSKPSGLEDFQLLNSLNTTIADRSEPDITDMSNTNLGPSNDYVQASSLLPSPKCQCRERLAILIPQAKKAMQEKKFNQVFQTMQSIVKSLQDIVGCRDCKTTCVDLISMAGVFQQTDTLFEYIVKAHIDSDIETNLGGYNIPITDPKLKVMLVTTLFYEATLVLDAISAKGQDMIKALCPPTPLADANIAHLEKFINTLRGVLQKLANSANGVTSDSPLTPFSTGLFTQSSLVG